MGLIKNLLALIGLVVVIGLVYVNTKVNLLEKYQQAMKLDPQAQEVYTHMVGTLLETGDIAKATVVKYKIDSDVSNDEVVEALNSVATEMGIKSVGDLPLSKEVELRTGKKQRYVRVLSYCNPTIAVDMVKFSMAYGAYLPCRIVIMEAEDGTRWLYALDMDMMIHGGQKLPPDMLEKGNKVKKTLYTMMEKASKGDF